MNASTTAHAAALGTVLDAQTLRMERTLGAPIETVWQFLVDPVKRARWLCGGSPAQAAGETMTLRFDNDKLTAEKPPAHFQQHAGVHEVHSRIVVLEPPTRLVMSWQEGSPDASEVSFELAADGERTHLTLVHRKLPRRGAMLNVAGGWHAHLDVLADVLAQREPRPFWSNFGAQQAAYDRIIPLGRA
jgi:uncharacterized protein YndB with AHSA1/START domain